MTRSRALRWQLERLRRRGSRAFASFLYRDVNRDENRSFMIAGAGRSGTTWLAELVCSQLPCRLMFEPFNPRKVSAYRRFNYFQYMRPGEHDAELREFCRSVFTGALRDRWVDRGVTVLRPSFRLIKEIRANLMLRWISTEFPAIPIVFLVRHPCAVVASRMKLGWATDDDIAPLLAQPRLVEDHLADRMHVVENARTAEEKHAVVWCVSNLVPMRQFGADGLTTVFYERLCADPAAEIERVLSRFGHPRAGSISVAPGRPSMMAAKDSAVVTGGDRLGGWKKDLTPRQVRSVLDVVEKFGLDGLYRGSAMPAVS